MSTTSNRALTEAIKHDHAEINHFYEQYQKASGDHDAQARWGRQFIWEVARHSVGEEIVVYPMFEQHLGAQGKQMADSDREDHLAVKKLLYEIEKKTPGTAEYDSLLNQAITELKSHMADEEGKDLPALEEKISAEDSEKTAKAFHLTKKAVPTRSHPSAPDQGGASETLSGFFAAHTDKLKDMFAKFPTEEQKQDAKSN